VQTKGEPRDVPEDVGLTVYRIVQEALTNVLKHAGPAHATVQLDFGGSLGVTVTDDGRGAATAVAEPAVPGAGRGTAGMRERVAALGGKLTTGPRAGGGFRVHATIPLEQA
jgi:signal transduction histidine kinase